MSNEEHLNESELTIVPVKTDSDIAVVATLAEEIWTTHFTPIIGAKQVTYMVDKFQSVPALTGQIKDGYEYFMLLYGWVLSGYCGVHQEADALFLSKLYIHEDFRGNHISTLTLQYLIELCKERNLHKIWLTCNKQNEHTLAVYKHLGFITKDSQVADIGNGFVMDDYILEYVIS